MNPPSPPPVTPAAPLSGTFILIAVVIFLGVAALIAFGVWQQARLVNATIHGNKQAGQLLETEAIGGIVSGVAADAFGRR